MGGLPWIRKERSPEDGDSVLTCTATPKLLPSSIRGICSCNQVVTCRERKASESHQPLNQSPGSYHPRPCPQRAKASWPSVSCRAWTSQAVSSFT